MRSRQRQPLPFVAPWRFQSKVPPAPPRQLPFAHSPSLPSLSVSKILLTGSSPVQRARSYAVSPP